MSKIKDTIGRVFGNAVRGVRETVRPSEEAKPANQSPEAHSSAPRKSTRRMYDPQRQCFVETSPEFREMFPDWAIKPERKKPDPYSEGPGDPMAAWRRGLYETDLFRD